LAGDRKLLRLCEREMITGSVVELIKEVTFSQVLVAHACNPTYLEAEIGSITV
jgi:hypothetical protein